MRIKKRIEKLEREQRRLNWRLKVQRQQFYRLRTSLERLELKEYAMNVDLVTSKPEQQVQITLTMEEARGLTAILYDSPLRDRLYGELRKAGVIQR